MGKKRIRTPEEIAAEQAELTRLHHENMLMDARIIIERQKLTQSEANSLMAVARGETVPVAAAIPLLKHALEQAMEHLSYTGYGDSWERECADHCKLSEYLEMVKGLEVTT